ncbi:MAG: hypothetical protein IJ809_01240 [Clostridia bacterium]|nr:hypothetical protein [Clostridia bacterium]
MLYLFLALLTVIPITMLAYTIWHLKNYAVTVEKKRKLDDMQTIRPYIDVESRVEILIIIGKEERNISDYYELERRIKYP